jgi:hypothetical protein
VVRQLFLRLNCAFGFALMHEIEEQKAATLSGGGAVLDNH